MKAKPERSKAVKRVAPDKIMKALEDKATGLRIDAGGRVDWNDGLTKAGREKYALTFEPGGPRHHFAIEAAKYKTQRDRVGFICALMSEGQWRTPMIYAFAKVWNLKASSVQQMYNNAGLALDVALGNKQVLRANTLAQLEAVAGEAREAGDSRTAVAALRTFAEVSGILKHQHEISGPDGGPVQLLGVVKHMTDAELDAEIAKANARRLQRLAEEEGRELTAAEKAIVEVALLPPAQNQLAHSEVSDAETLDAEVDTDATGAMMHGDE